MIEDLNAPFEPDWVSPPGDSILDLAEERGWTQAELAQRLGYTEKHISQLIHGKVPLSVDAAFRLERVLGSSADFWLAREANYQRHLARLQAQNQHAAWVPWLEQLPLKALMACGALSQVRLDAKHKPALVDQCLRFFGVASPDEWQAHYGGLQFSFRRTRTDQADLGAISAWLRLGEQQAEQTTTPKYDRSAFIETLHALRGLTDELPEVFVPQMGQRLHDAGVVLVLVPALPKAHVSGVARWLDGRPVIQLSLYGKSNDRFWFTFFHEAAHILLHAGSRDARKSVFLDDPGAEADDSSQEEREANDWASTWLIPSDAAAELPRLRSESAVLAFAQRIGIHPGIVVGRLQHDVVIPATWLNGLKQRFQLAPE